MLDVEIIEDPAAAAVALDPVRAAILAALAEPASAAGLAQKLGLPRQKVHYHLTTLAAHGLVAPAGEKLWGGLTERRFVATALGYVVSPAALGPAAPRRTPASDGISADHLLALAARALREVGAMWRRARAGGTRLATLSLDAEIAFASPAARADFTRDLAEAVARLVARYHDPAAPGARPHRLLAMAHPLPEGDET
jgi:DNA-binding transcriptional ArsR family regulator